MTRLDNGPRKPTDRKPTDRKANGHGTADADTSASEKGKAAPSGRQRIAKLMARVGLCSRRDAEAWIVDGRVTLNGAVLTSPAQDVGSHDTILVDGLPLPDADKTRLFLFHKLRGLVTSDHDPEGRQTVTDYLRETWPDGPRVVTVGRLDINTEGLLLLTNDGGLARVLELPATGWVRRYRVRAKGETDQGVLDRLRDGVSIEGVDYAGIEAKLDRTQGANSWLTMGLREGKNREIKRVLEHVGLEVNRLIRLSFGPFQLLDLPEGKVEEVRTRVLRDQLGESLAAEAGVDFQDEPVVVPAFHAETTILSRGTRLIQGPAGGNLSRSRAGGPPERKPKTGERGPRRSDAPGFRTSHEEQPDRRERPVGGTRKHVSALRAEGTADLRQGPRKRIERTDTKDRKDRTVSVERLVSTRPEPRARRGAGRFAPRDPSRQGAPKRAAREPRPDGSKRDQRHERPARERTQESGGRDHASPSAMAKRVRVSRSGGAKVAESRAPHAFTTRADRPPRGDRPAARGPTGGKERSVKPWADVPVAEQRPARRSHEERPARPARGDAPARGTFDAGARPARVERAMREERKPFAGKARTGERPRADAKPRFDRSKREPGSDKARDSRPGNPKPHDDKRMGERRFGEKRMGEKRIGEKRTGEKPRHAGAERRVGERNAGERDARKAGKRAAPGRGGDKPGGPDRGSKGPPRGPAGRPRAKKPQD